MEGKAGRGDPVQSDTISFRIRKIRVAKFGERGAMRCARESDIPYPTYRNYEHNTEPPARNLVKFCMATGANVEYVVLGIGEPFGPRLDEKPLIANPAEALRKIADRLDKKPGTGIPGNSSEADLFGDYFQLSIYDIDAVRMFGREPLTMSSDSLFVLREFVPHPNHTACVRMPDDSMAGVINHRSVVAVDFETKWHDITEPVKDCLVAAVTPDGVTVRRVQTVQSGAVNLCLLTASESMQDKFPPITILPDDPDSWIAGIVVFAAVRFASPHDHLRVFKMLG